MKHFVIVLSIILFVSLTFLNPSIIEDASFNDYTYLRNLRRSNNTIDNEYTQKKLYDTTFTDQGSSTTSSETSTPFSNTVKTQTPTGVSTAMPTGVPTNDSKSSETSSNQTNVNLLPYLLLLLILLVVIIVYIKYKMENP
jgi:hypothetical protein